MSWIPVAVRDSRAVNATGRFLFKHRTKFIVASAIAIGVGLYYQLTTPSPSVDDDVDEDGNAIPVGVRTNKNAASGPSIKPGMRSR